ncbi:Fe-S protein assembly co-chaperone HscB [Buchnera aphidicola (Hyperomyzus lactucae)]|uniref:Co-chaperone protein HscB n=1 Tax=Buchnera aphidicola (Hyperomyzus lactucae) TaxID=1241860 RepID=A0A4D6XU67_9GAMM|nr:Fe-S protein assembly co-chaperone HscB [Buchnera aphidicola]QCI21302.1 Fe-S protein assembly co-chaperone HscB [Buchnera aphidicola (Hyperomyzus lactucae)]
MNYFTLFNLPEKFKINKNLLCKNYYQLQLQFHPDLFIKDSESQKKIVLEKSIQINKGYRTLKNFLNRAVYLLSLHGFQIEKETFLLKNNNFLIEYFSLYEEIDNLKESCFDELLLTSLLKKIKQKINNYEHEIDLEFDKKNFKKVVKITAKLLFLNKMKLNLKKEHNIYLKKDKLG